MIMAGSKGEGIKMTESDCDFMIVIENTICVDRANFTGHFNVLETDYSNTTPGYTKVVLKYLDAGIDLENFCMYNSVAGSPYVSSTMFRNFCYQGVCSENISLLVFSSSGYNTSIYERTSTNGPATTKELGTLNVDFVPSMYFYGGSYLSKWANRVRYSNMPSDDLIHEISQTEGYIVPVGYKQSDCQNIEWRICYTTAEMKLISSLSDTQIKLYVLLKMIAKKVLKPVCRQITSYIVENVVLWKMETQAACHFAPELLVNLLKRSLLFIKYCLLNNHFPNYMIPERNMFGLEVVGYGKQRTTEFLSQCLEDTVSLVLKIPELYRCVSCMFDKPERVIRSYGEWRNEVEILYLISLLQHNDNMISFPSSIIEMEREYWKDERYTDTLRKIMNLVVPEHIDLLRAGELGEIMNRYLSRIKGVNPL